MAAEGKPGGTPAAPRARADTLPADSPLRDHPPVGWGEHLIGWLWDLGGCSLQGEWATGFDWSVLRSWAAMTATPVTAWEARALHQLSAAYAAEINAARDPDRPAPWRPTDTGRQRPDTPAARSLFATA